MSSRWLGGQLYFDDRHEITACEAITYHLSILPRPATPARLFMRFDGKDPLELLDPGGNLAVNARLVTIDVPRGELLQGNSFKSYPIRPRRRLSFWGARAWEGQSDLGPTFRFLLFAVERDGAVFLSNLTFVANNNTAIKRLYETLQTAFPFDWVTPVNNIVCERTSLFEDSLEWSVSSAGAEPFALRVDAIKLYTVGEGEIVVSIYLGRALVIKSKTRRTLNCVVNGEVYDRLELNGDNEASVPLPLRGLGDEESDMIVQVFEGAEKVLFLGYVCFHQTTVEERGSPAVEWLRVYHQALVNWPTFVRVQAVNGNIDIVQRAFRALTWERMIRAMGHQDRHGNTVFHVVASIGDAKMLDALFHIGELPLPANILLMKNKAGLTAAEICYEQAGKAADVQTQNLWRRCGRVAAGEECCHEAAIPGEPVMHAARVPLFPHELRATTDPSLNLIVAAGVYQCQIYPPVVLSLFHSERR